MRSLCNRGAAQAESAESCAGIGTGPWKQTEDKSDRGYHYPVVQDAGFGGKSSGKRRQARRLSEDRLPNPVFRITLPVIALLAAFLRMKSASTREPVALCQQISLFKKWLVADWHRLSRRE